MGAAYSFVSEWDVPADAGRCWDELVRSLSAGGGPTWWRGVLVADGLERPEVGESITLVVRSPVGYRLRMRLTITDLVPGRLVAATSSGDLRGAGRVDIEPTGAASALVRIHWDVVTERPWMNASAPLLRPLFSAAHAAVMRAGERGLRAALTG